MNRPFAVALLAGSLVVTSTALAQVQPAGAPAEGVDLNYRYTNPSQSQQLLTVQPPAAEGAAGATVESGAATDAGYSARITGVDGEEATAEGVWVEGADVYTGLVPGERDTLPHLSRTQARGASGQMNTLTWLGFQPLEGSTRVFLQTGRSADYGVQTSPDGMTVTISLANTKVEVRNFLRYIDASYFGRSVSRIETVSSRGDGTTVVIALSRPAEYSVARDGNYLYVDFTE